MYYLVMHIVYVGRGFPAHVRIGAFDVYISAWAPCCLFLLVGQCEGLNKRNKQQQGPRFLYICPYLSADTQHRLKHIRRPQPNVFFMDKMVVLYVCSDSTMGGSTASLWNLIKSVEDKVYPIVLFPEQGQGFDYFTERGVECYVYPFIILFKFQRNKLIDVWQHPWRWHYIKKWRFDHQCLWFVKKILRGRRIDIVHTNTSIADVGVLIAKGLHAKHIWHIREFIDRDFHFEVYRGLQHLRAQIYKSDAIIAISSAVAQHHQLPPNKTFVIHNAVRSINDTCYIASKERYILFASYYLTKEKGVLWAIRAFELSGLAADGYRLCLMGNIIDSVKDELMQTIRHCTCASAIELVPCQLDVKPYFAKASAYIMASEYEGLGRVTAEAMFYGCPVIARATGGTLDIVKDKETGYLFTTIEECALWIRYVCTTDQSEIIHKAQTYACENLSQEVYGNQIMQVYQKVLQQ